MVMTMFLNDMCFDQAGRVTSDFIASQSRKCVVAGAETKQLPVIQLNRPNHIGPTVGIRILPRQADAIKNLLLVIWTSEGPDWLGSS